MASAVAENWEHTDGSEFSHELSLRDHGLLMSLLDETPVDDCDDERLRNVIRSLEAEIDSTRHYYAPDGGAWEGDPVDPQSSIDEPYGQNPSMTCDDLHLRWMDVEITPASPSGTDVGSWYMEDQHGRGMMSEFGWVQSYSPPEADQQECSLWHDTDAAVI